MQEMVGLDQAGLGTRDRGDVEDRSSRRRNPMAGLLPEVTNSKPAVVVDDSRELAPTSGQVSEVHVVQVQPPLGTTLGQRGAAVRHHDMVVVQAHHSMTEHAVPRRRVGRQVHGSDRIDPLAETDEDAAAHHAMQRFVAHAPRYRFTA